MQFSANVRKLEDQISVIVMEIIDAYNFCFNAKHTVNTIVGSAVCVLRSNCRDYKISIYLIVSPNSAVSEYKCTVQIGESTSENGVGKFSGIAYDNSWFVMIPDYMRYVSDACINFNVTFMKKCTCPVSST